MEIPLTLENKGAIYALTTSPQAVDLTSYIGSYVRIKSSDDADRFYFCGIPTSLLPTVNTAATASEDYHGSAGVPHVAEYGAGGATGTHFFVTNDNPYLWIRTITGTLTVTIKPAGRPGQ